MGVMSKSKGTRLPERPKPPSWEDISEDVSSADQDDIVFTVGKTNLPKISAQPLREKGSATGGSGGADSDLDLSQTDPEEAQASYERVLRLITSHERLSAVPLSLREQYSNLRGMGQAMEGSISQLKDLARSVARDSRVHQTSTKTEDPGGKGKAKPKRKK